MFDALLEKVIGVGGQPAGLGARDTLRTEMGYALHGHELSTEITPSRPASAGPSAGTNRNSSVVTRCSPRKRRVRRAGSTVCGQPAAASPRDGCVVNAADGQQIGVCTSGTFSPTLKHGIALALLDLASGVRRATRSLSTSVAGRWRSRHPAIRRIARVAGRRKPLAARR